MPKSVKLRTLDQDGENEEIVELEFTDDEWEILQDFAKYAGELENNSLVKEGIPSSLNVTWTEREGLKVDTKLPSDEQIDAMLMKLRPFILSDERTSFNRVRGILRKKEKSQRARKHLDTLQFLYSGERLQSLFVAGAYSSDQDPKVINSEEMLHIWLNGDRFHKEKEKQRILAAMHGLMPPESSVAMFLFLISDKVEAILGLRRIVALFAGEQESIFAQIILEEPIHYHAFLHASIAQVSVLSLEEQPYPLPEEGKPFSRVFDFTAQGPATFHQLLDPIGRLWMLGRLIYELGERFYLFRVAPGFRTENGSVYQHGADVIATFKVVAFLVEDPLSKARRKPMQAVLEQMQAEKDGIGSRKTVLRAVETKEELDKILGRDPEPRVDYKVVPRVAFMWAYWPISRKARERFHKIYMEGRTPTFEEVEGADIFSAWEIFEEEGEDKQEA